MSDSDEKRWTHFELEALARDVKDIKDTVHTLQQTKQDKIRASVIIPIILYLFAQAAYAIYWSGDVNRAVLETKGLVTELRNGGFSGKDGDSLRKYFDLVIENTKLEQKHNRALIERLESRQDATDLRLKEAGK